MCFEVKTYMHKAANISVPNPPMAATAIGRSMSPPSSRFSARTESLMVVTVSGESFCPDRKRMGFLKKKHGHRGACENHPQEINFFDQGSEGGDGKEQVGPVPMNMQG